MKLANVLICLAVALAWSFPVTAAPRSMADCEKIKDDDAYNRCLASFGPKRGASGGSGRAYPYKASGGTSHAGQSRARGGRAYRGISVQRTKSGRVRTIISVPKRGGRR